MVMHKQGELSMSTIVMAVIAVIILIILSSLVIRNLGNTNEQVQSCQNKGGVCADSCEELSELTGQSYTRLPTLSCSVDVGQQTQQVCCVRG